MTVGCQASSASRSVRGSARSILKCSLLRSRGPAQANTSAPSRRKASTRYRPTKPVAPVTSARMAIALRAHARGEAIQIGFDHHGNELLEAHFGLPAQRAPGFARIPDQHVDFGRTNETRIDYHVGFERTEAGHLKGDAHEFAHAVRSSGGDHEVVRP